MIMIGMIASCYAFYPGCMSGDTMFSWGTIPFTAGATNMHPPLMAYSWYLLNKLPFSFNPRYADLFIAMNLLFWTGLILAIRPWFSQRLLWIIFFLCVGFFPPAFGIVSQPIKDSLMCAALLAAYGGLLVAEQRHSRLAFGFGLFCLFLALGYRYNALFAVLPLALWAGAIFCRSTPERQWWEKTIVGTTIFVALLAYVSTANQLLTEKQAYPEQQLYSFDLVGISVKTGHVYLPEFYNDDKKAFLFGTKGSNIKGNTITMDNIRLLYAPDSNLLISSYGAGKGLRTLDNAEEIAILRRSWLKAIFHEPITYLKVHKDLYWSLMGLARNNFWPYFCMVKDKPDHDYPMQPTLPHFYMDIKDTWLFKGVTYMSVIALLTAIICWKRNFFPAHLRFLGASGLTYGASYFIIGLSSDFRYLYWLIPVSVIMAVNMIFMVITSKRI